MHRLRNTLIAIFLFLTMGSMHCHAEELRIILDEDFNWMTKEDADNTIRRIKAAGFNVFVPCVWHGRGVSWKSSLAPKEPRWADKLKPLPDPLAYLIERAHAEGIQVRPWFTVSLRQRVFFTDWYDSGTPENSFDVHNPEFRTYMVNLISEVTKNYNVDGITLDFIRSRGVCLSDHCVEDYSKTMKADLRKDFAEYKKLDSPGWTRIAQWNAPPINDMVKRIRSSMKGIKPDLPLQVCSHAGMKFLLGEGTNSIEWVNSGLIDLILHMDYARLDKLDRPLMNSAISRVNDKNKLILMVGNYDTPPLDKSKPYARDKDEVVNLLAFSRALNPNSTSVALYEYRFLVDEQIKPIHDFFNSPPSAPTIKAIPLK